MLPHVPALAAATALALAMNANADTQLTIYSGDFDTLASSMPGQGMAGFALVRTQPSFELVAGANTLTLTGLPAAIDASGVRFVPAGKGIDVTGQRFDFALADQSELLRRSVGQRVSVEQAVGSTRETYTGTLLAAGDGLTLALDDGRVRVLADYIGFELAQLPDGLYARPTLRWEAQAARAGREQFALDYPTGGLAWRAEYVATLGAADQRCRMSLEGAAQVMNRSGASFDAAKVTLVAGEPNRQRAPQPQMMMAKSMDMIEVSGSRIPQPQASGEYHAYPLPQRVTLPDGSVQRVPLMAAAGAVDCARRYETESAMGRFRPSSPIVHPDFLPAGMQPVMAMLEFANRKEAGLGMPLPAGRLRVFERGAGEAEDFLGESAIGHTAAGSDVRAALGEAFDLSAERSAESFELDADRLGLSERFALKLRNAKPGAATIRVVESLPRWTDWEVVDASAQWTKRDANTIVFDMPVPANGEATLRYTVRYRWPDSFKP